MLEIKDLHVNYGAVHALNGVSMTVKDGEIVSLIGANGAGKTTTLRTITGLEKAAGGSITFDGHDLRKTDGRRLRAVPPLKRAQTPAGRSALRRRAADAGRWPRPDGQTQDDFDG